jgi:hypothetical protein
MYSSNGIDWTPGTPADDSLNYWNSVCWSKETGLLLAVCASGNGNKVMFSEDGNSWSSVPAASNDNWTSVCYSPELHLYCAVAGYGSD